MHLLGTNRILTTAYHPIANGLVERFHCQLKGALKCMSDPTHWTKALPLILLGIRTTIKQDLKCTSVELVYGTTLRLPGEFFYAHTTYTTNPTSYVTQLKTIMEKIRPSSSRQPQQRKTYISSDIYTCPFVFMRNDTVKRLLQHRYDGPFQVLHRTNKHFTLDIAGKKKVVSLDRLKPAYLDDSSPSTNDVSSSDTSPLTTNDASSNTSPLPAQPITQNVKLPAPPSSTTTSRSGHRVHWRRKLVEYRLFA